MVRKSHSKHPRLVDLCTVFLLGLCLFSPIIVLGQSGAEPVTGMEFVVVPGGCYQMGCSFWTWAMVCDDNEYPVHEVYVSDFEIGKYEVTQAQWEAVMGSNPSHFKKGGNYPVERVSWNVVTLTFLKKLNAMSGDGYTYRLPTEAEWEYAARSRGRKEKYSGGDDIDRVAWYKGNSGITTQPVGTKAPNGLGIHDMTGNVWEWCQDIYSENAYSSHSRDNPLYSGDGPFRVKRGGCWDNFPWYTRTTSRDRIDPDGQYRRTGFRLVRIR